MNARRRLLQAQVGLTQNVSVPTRFLEPFSGLNGRKHGNQNRHERVRYRYLRKYKFCIPLHSFLGAFVKAGAQEMATGTPFVGVKLDVACGSNFRQSFCNRDSSVFGVAEHLGLWLASVFVPVIQRENFLCEGKPFCVSYLVRILAANVKAYYSRRKIRWYQHIFCCHSTCFIGDGDDDVLMR